MEIKTVEINETETRTNERILTLAEYDNVNLKVSYYWDSHGKLVNWNDLVNKPKFWSCVKVRIDECSYSQTFDFMDKTMDFKDINLYVNDELISSDVVEVSRRRSKDGTVTVYCKIIIGWG